MPAARSVGAFLIVVFLVGCGGGVEGRYVGKGETFFESLTFRSDNKVEIVFINQKAEGAFEVAGNTITMTVPNGDKAALVLDGNGCLTNSLIGTYCKDGSAPGASVSSDSLAGGLAKQYEAQAQEGRIALEFGDARKVRVTMTPAGVSDIPDRMSFDVGYDVNGDEITINLPGNERLLLTRAGSDLEGTMNGETVRFVRR